MALLLLPVVAQDEADIWTTAQQLENEFYNDGSTRLRIRNLTGATYSGQVVQVRESSHGHLHHIPFTLTGAEEVVIEDINPAKFNDNLTGRALITFDTDPSPDVVILVRRGRTR